MPYVLRFFYPTASATAYAQRLKFFRAEHSATAEGENCAYGPKLKYRLLILLAGNAALAAKSNWLVKATLASKRCLLFQIV